MQYVIYAAPAVLWTGIFMLAGPVKEAAAKLRPGRLAKSIVPKNSSVKKLWLGFKTKRKRARLEQELSESLAYIKNIAVLGRGENISAELLLSELAEFSKDLQPVFLSMAHHLHLNEKEKASQVLYQAMEVGYAKDIGEFLASWEDIAPADLIKTIDVYRGTLREARLTRLKQKDELISDLIYFPVVVNCMTVLLNFIYIAYFIEQQEALSLLF